MDNSSWDQKAIDCIQNTVKVNQLFVVRELFQGAEWEKLTNGEKRDYGKHFKNEVKQGNIPNVVYVQKRNNNHAEYKKIKENNK